MVKSMKLTEFTQLMVAATISLLLLAPLSVSQNPANVTSGIPAGWSEDINLSNNMSMEDVYCNMAVYEDDVHMIWEHHWDNDRHIAYSKSQDGGLNWSPMTFLYDTTIYGKQPDIVAWDDNVHTVWGDWDVSEGIYYSNSTDGGNTWNPIRRISSMGVEAMGAQLFVNYSNVHIIWWDQRDGAQGEIYYRRSMDGGITWDNGQGVDVDRRIIFNPSATGNIAFAGSGSNLSIIWSDERNGNFDIYWMISKDNGYTWENGLGTPDVGRQLTADATDSMWNSIAMDGSNIRIVWMDESWPGPEYRIYYRDSSDSGVIWNPIQLLTGPSPLMAQPDIAIFENNLHVTWDDARDDGSTMEIYYKNSTNGGVSWGQDVRLTYSPGSHSYHPKLGLNNSTVHVTWWDRRDGNREIYYKRSPDFPDTAAPSHSNEIPIPDSYKDAPGTNVSVHVTDPSGVNASTIQLWINGSLVSPTLTPIADGYNVSWISGGFGPGVVNCRIIAEDMLNNFLDYTWNFTVLALYDIPLHFGWNLISLPLEQVDSSVPSVLASIDDQYDVVKYYDNLDKADPWKSYRPGSSVNDLTGIDNTMGLWVHTTQFCNLTVRGIVPTSTQINLYAGWNLVGYPTQTTETVGNALWGTGADRVEVFDPVSPYIKEAGATYVMKPGEGYWVHVSADSTWTINW